LTGKINSSPQHSDKECSERGAREYLKFINENKHFLKNVKNGSKYIQVVESLIEQRAPFTDKQKSYIDVIYEKTMKGYGMPSFERTYKPKKRRV